VAFFVTYFRPWASFWLGWLAGRWCGFLRAEFRSRQEKAEGQIGGQAFISIDLLGWLRESWSNGVSKTKCNDDELGKGFGLSREHYNKLVPQTKEKKRSMVMFLFDNGCVSGCLIDGFLRSWCWVVIDDDKYESLVFIQSTGWESLYQYPFSPNPLPLLFS